MRLLTGHGVLNIAAKAEPGSGQAAMGDGEAAAFGRTAVTKIAM
jgi:hypothetical protein